MGGLVLGLVLLRFILALGPFPVTMGFNEAYYAISAEDYRRETFTPTVCTSYGECRPHLKVPPLLSTLIAVLPDGEFWTRLPSLLAWTGSILLAWRLRGEWAALALTATPWLFLWMGRAQTESLLVFTLLLTVYGLDRQKPWAWVLGIAFGLLSKQTYLLAFPLFLYPATLRPRNAMLIGAAFGPALAWWLLQAQTHPSVFMEDWLFHAQSRQAGLGEAWAEVAALGLVLGGLPFLALLRPTRADWRLTLTVALFAGFALLNAPHSHSYYTVPALALAALLVKAPQTAPWLVGVPASAVALSLILAGFGGELDRPILQPALAGIPEGGYIQSNLWPQAEYYGYAYQIEGDSCPAAPNRTILCSRTPPGCVELERWQGAFDRLILSWCPP
jgi:hypothetical protein